LGEELPRNTARVVATTKHGQIKGGRAANGAVVFLEVPYALPPGRFEDPNPLPANFKYEDIDYIYEKSYAVQPNNDGQAAGASFVLKVGLGKPTENPLFVNIACPPSFPLSGNFPVKVHIHGGFLQFGSPHSLSSQAQYVSVTRSEVWVNIGYRLSAFGFLACDEPKISGNFGFKDQWMALEYIKDNISAFGGTVLLFLMYPGTIRVTLTFPIAGNPDDIQVTGLSAGCTANFSWKIKLTHSSRCTLSPSATTLCLAFAPRHKSAIPFCHFTIQCHGYKSEDAPRAPPPIPRFMSGAKLRPQRF